jgi:hypothetical protein
MSAAEDLIKNRPLLAYMSLFWIIVIVVITFVSLVRGNVSERRFEEEMKAKADTAYVLNQIEQHRLKSEGAIMDTLALMNETMEKTLEILSR